MITKKSNIDLQIKSMLTLGIKQKVINSFLNKYKRNELFSKLLDAEIKYFKQIREIEIEKMDDAITTDQDVEVLNNVITPEMEKHAEDDWPEFARKKEGLSNTEKSLVSIINMQEMRARVKNSKIKIIVMGQDVKNKLIKYSELLKMQYGF